MPAKSFATIRPCEYAVLWKTLTVGWIKNVDMSKLEPLLIPKKVEEIGDLVIDELYAGITGVISSMIKQRDLASIRQLMLDAPGSGSIPLFGTEQYKSMYSLSGLLTIHPTHMADATEDLNILHAVPIIKMPASTEGKNTQDIAVDWRLYPDHTELAETPPVLLYGYVGAVPV